MAMTMSATKGTSTVQPSDAIIDRCVVVVTPPLEAVVCIDSRNHTAPIGSTASNAPTTLKILAARSRPGVFPAFPEVAVGCSTTPAEASSGEGAGDRKVMSGLPVVEHVRVRYRGPEQRRSKPPKLPAATASNLLAQRRRNSGVYFDASNPGRLRRRDIGSSGPVSIAGSSSGRRLRSWLRSRRCAKRWLAHEHAEDFDDGAGVVVGDALGECFEGVEPTELGVGLVGSGNSIAFEYRSAC